uniref:TBC1 domain family member 15 n=1 Tax=Nothobranchius furzeri TaxID=105023 RepID=A0A8C6PJJ6_NOTFU
PLLFVSQVIFEHEGVFIHPNTEEEGTEPDLLVSGSLRILEKVRQLLVPRDDAVVIHWRCVCSTLSGHVTCPSIIGLMFCSRRTETSCLSLWQDAEVLVDFRPLEDPVDPSNILERSRWAFSVSVSDLRSITVKDEGWTFVILQQKEPSTSLPALHFHQGGSREFLDNLRRFKHLPDSFPRRTGSGSYWTFAFCLQKFRRDPYVATFGGLSKVTNYIYDALRGAEEQQQQRPPEEVADLLGEVIPGLEINQQEEPGFEVITRIDLGMRPQVTRREPLSADRWSKHLDMEGRVQDVDQLKHEVFKGGLCHAVRKELWKFLLGYFPWSSTSEERRCLQRVKIDEYFRMKLQWKSVSEEQERRNSRLRDFRSLIEKDVDRTDRTNWFYEGLNNPGLTLLHDILMTYCMYDFDLGYVQGMSDLLSPILYVMENEVDAFWCFVSFMDQMHQNFEEQMQGMKTQLIQLSTLLRLLDLTFWNYLESQESGYLYFCFRWLLIRFKRELSFQDVLRLWEVMWTGLPCQNFHLLICCSILDSEKQKIMEENFGFNEILKHINELSMKLNIEEILQKAEGLFHQIRSCKVCVCALFISSTPNSLSDPLPDFSLVKHTANNQATFLRTLSYFL